MALGGDAVLKYHVLRNRSVSNTTPNMDNISRKRRTLGYLKIPAAHKMAFVRLSRTPFDVARKNKGQRHKERDTRMRYHL